MPGSMPATSQLDWLISMTAMIVLFWSRATRDLLKSFGWGIAALHRLHPATKLPLFDSSSCMAPYGVASARREGPGAPLEFRKICTAIVPRAPANHLLRAFSWRTTMSTPHKHHFVPAFYL